MNETGTEWQLWMREDRDMLATKMRVRDEAPWPNVPEGMVLHLDSAGNQPNAMLVMGMRKPSAGEEKAIRQKPLRVGITTSDPLTWITVEGEKVSFDAPYGLGIVEKAEQIRTQLRAVDGWTDATRCAVTIVLVDSRDNTIRGLRYATLGKTWWSVFANAILAQPEHMTRATYDAALDADMRRYPSTQHLVRAAKIIEPLGL